ncbi:hypothetical protein [Pseudoalteromonas luteoviolacea]|uniref:hypothetical protein n=1 Tax=Pseudoalteromonas luteoviolacea TaxID=43657 RepID=UPI001B3918A9|nr:hypothetical protein [Pseudoalteromonas luteoviolacea]MBQ4839779.1 hypothetical protein [Pseudoalteromonas luteoviolacea]
MSKPLGFRCPQILHDEIEIIMKNTGKSKTDTCVFLIELGIQVLKENQSTSTNARLQLLARLSVQILAITNQLGELAGDDVLQNAEQEYTALLKQLEID